MSWIKTTSFITLECVFLYMHIVYFWTLHSQVYETLKRLSLKLNCDGEDRDTNIFLLKPCFRRSHATYVSYMISTKGWAFCRSHCGRTCFNMAWLWRNQSVFVICFITIWVVFLYIHMPNVWKKLRKHKVFLRERQMLHSLSIFLTQIQDAIITSLGFW